MNTVPAQEIKRKGISAVDEYLAEEPLVHVIKSNRPQYVVMSEDYYSELMQDLDAAWELRIRASLEDVKAGRVKCGTARELMQEILADH